MRFISLGAGVQSCAMVLLADEGKIDADVALFADTGSERPETYAYLRDVLLPRAKIPIKWIGWGRPLEERKLVGVPTFTLIDGKKGHRRRTCTDHTKIRIVRRWLRSHNVTHAACMLGFTTDEADRMFDSDVKWVENRYPLIDMGMSRADCERFFVERGLPIPPKSSCYFCPFHDARYWLEMRENDPISFAKACRAEEISGTFLTVVRVPLARAVDTMQAQDDGGCRKGCMT